jgi:hypothetical protein
MVIEPVKGKVKLRNLEPSPQVEIIPLNGSGRAVGDTIKAHNFEGGFTFCIGEPTTPWYLVRVRRN